MRSKPVKKIFIFFFLLFVTTVAFSQKEFFRSHQAFAKEQMSNFYSSVKIHDNLVIFNANDYHLYAYNKKDGSLKWSVETNYKTSVPVFVQDNIIYAGISKKEVHQAAQFDLANGNLIKALPFGHQTIHKKRDALWYSYLQFWLHTCIRYEKRYGCLESFYCTWIRTPALFSGK